MRIFSCYEDLVRGLDHVLATYTFTDATRLAAACASCGGYMMNWFLANPDRFPRFNPSEHVENLRTPMLVIHGGLDYRVPLKPQNAKVWWETVYDWLDRWLTAPSNWTPAP